MDRPQPFGVCVVFPLNDTDATPPASVPQNSAQVEKCTKGTKCCLNPTEVRKHPMATSDGVAAALAAPIFMVVGFIFWEQHWKGRSSFRVFLGSWAWVQYRGLLLNCKK